MSEWLIHCTDNLKSGAYYASVDIYDDEQPVMILFRKDGEKTFVVGQGKPINPHGRLIDADALIKVLSNYGQDICAGWVEDAPTILPADSAEDGE